MPAEEFSVVAEPGFATRSEFVSAIDDGDYDSDPDGVMIQAGGYQYRKVTTPFGNPHPIPDMPDWVPVGRPTVYHFGASGDGSVDEGGVFQAALNSCPDVYVPSGEYLFDSQVVVQKDGRRIEMAGGAKIIHGDSIAALNIFHAAGNLGSTQTTCSTDLAVGAISIPVASTAGFSAGMRVRLKSAEYFTGISGTGGWGLVTKGEFAQIVEVGTGNVLKLASPLKDNYTGSVYSVTVRVANFVDGFEVIGGEYQGRNNAEIETGASRGGLAGGEYLIHGTFRGGIGVGVSSAFYWVVNSIECTAQPFSVTGPVVGGPGNGDLTSTKWGKGFTVQSSESCSLIGGTYWNLRRPMDVTSSNGSIISRDCAQIGTVANNCNNLVATHQCQNFTASGNVGTCDKFMYFRGVDGVFSNNICTVTGDDMDAAFLIGNAPTGAAAYAENPSAGKVVMTGNVAKGVFGAGLQVKASLQSLIFSGNDVGTCTRGFEFHGKHVRSVMIQGNVFRGAPATYASDSYFGIVANHSLSPCEVLDGFRVTGNTFTGKFRRGFLVLGAGSGSGAVNVEIVGNISDFCEQRLIDSIGTSPYNYGSAGSFANPLVRRNNTVLEMTNTTVLPGSVAGGWALMEENDEIPGIQSLKVASRTDAAPHTRRSYLRGSILYYPGPDVSGALGRVCVQAGTEGSLGSGRTGSMTAASAELTLSSADFVSIGSYLIVTGSGMTAAARVVALNGLTVTMSETAVNTVTAVAVKYTSPIWRDLGL